MKKLFFLLFLMSFYMVDAQKKAKDSNDQDDEFFLPGNRDIARFQIRDLHDKFVLVRLRQKTRQVEALRAAGNNALADKIETKNRMANLLLIEGFVKNYNFSKVYFITTATSAHPKRGDTVECVDYNMKKLTDFVLPTDTFYILEFGELYANERSQALTKDMKKTYQGTEVASSSALVLKNEKLEQLQPPMPCYSILPFIEPYDFVTKNLNNRLVNYYCKTMKKVEGKELSNDIEWWKVKNPNKITFEGWLEKIDAAITEYKKTNKDFIRQR